MKLWHKIIEAFAGWWTRQKERRNIARWRQVASTGPPELYDCLQNVWGHAFHFDGKAIETTSLDPEGCFVECYGFLTPMPRPGDEVLKMGSDDSGPRPVILRFVEVRPHRDPRDMFHGVAVAIGYLTADNNTWGRRYNLVEKK